MKARPIFITGTDTDAGKTVLTALLLCHLRRTDVRALAIKPVSAGSREDGKVLHAFQQAEATLDETNPFHFSAPLAPLVAGREEGQPAAFEAVINGIRRVQRKCELLLIEGAGGLLSPLGEKTISGRSKGILAARRPGIFSALDIIQALRCQVLLVAPNKIGIINQVMLNAICMQVASIQSFRIVLWNPEKPDLSLKTTQELLTELLPKTASFNLPFLGKNASSQTIIEEAAKKLKKTLAEILG
jgi:dethiobiotin synthetase